VPQIHDYEFAGPPAPRVCGRCRLLFSGDGTLAQDLDTGWWACPACHESLLGAGAVRASRRGPAAAR
jgi:hypothetical protein